MFFRKKTPKPIDLSALDAFKTAANTPDLDGTGSFNPASPIEDVPQPTSFEQNPFDEWRSLGEEAWRVLNERRIAEIFPGCDDFDACSEFLLYWELIQRSSSRYRREIFVGLRPSPEKPAPAFVPRSTFDGHSYILGKPARGKTSQALTTLLLQLAYPENPGDEPPAIVIIDLKPQGDRFLRAVADLIAQQRGQELRFFSNAARYESLLFDPWTVIGSRNDMQAQAETLFKGMSLIHPESQDSVFFMNEQRYVLEKALLRKPRSLRELILILEGLTREKGGNSEARGAHGALQIFENATNIVVDGRVPPGAEVIDFRNLLNHREVLYVHLESDEKHLSSQATGKLLLSCLLTAAKQRREDEQLDAAKVYVAIDEFHRLAAQNVVSFLETSRDIVHFILSHQSPESLRSKNDDLFRLLFDITSFQQYLSLTNADAIDLLRLVSSRRSEFLQSSSRGTTQSRSESTGWNEGRTEGTSGGYSYSYGLYGKEERWSDGWNESRSQGISGGTQSGRADHQGTGESETKIPALTPEMIVRVNDPGERVSLIVSWGEQDSSISPFQGGPTLVHRIFPFSKSLADSFRRDAWPLRTPPTHSAQSSEPKGPLFLPGPKAKGRTKRDHYNDIGEDLFNASGTKPVGGKRSRASKPKKKKGPKKTKGSEEPLV
ncbi:MAG: hypothetical protein IPM64_00120 [Phycisphaerales bacterium]|nr:hypothetical protein [Phycisphaerales bacterium]